MLLALAIMSGRSRRSSTYLERRVGPRVRRCAIPNLFNSQSVHEDLRQRFEGDLNACPFCQSKDWMPIPGLIHIVIDTETPMGTFGWPAIALLCGHCSFVRIHSAFPSIEQARAVMEASNDDPPPELPDSN